MEARLSRYRSLVIVTAFEQTPDNPNFRFDLPGNRWQLLHNKTKAIRRFQESSFSADEPQFQHDLGHHAIEHGNSIPDEWFGNSPEAVALSKSFWDADQTHEWILHPYVYLSDSMLSLEVHMTKRMSKTSQYRAYVRNIVGPAIGKHPAANNITIDLYFRDTTESLARLNWTKDLPYATYQDELMKKSLLEKRDSWE
jgi:hypothetical protein